MKTFLLLMAVCTVGTALLQAGIRVRCAPLVFHPGSGGYHNMCFRWQMAGTVGTKQNHTRTLKTFGQMWFYDIHSHTVGPKALHTPEPEVGEGRNCVRPWHGWAGKEMCNTIKVSTCWPQGLCCCCNFAWTTFPPDFISSLYPGLCPSSEGPSLISPEIETQKPSHSIILILLYFHSQRSPPHEPIYRIIYRSTCAPALFRGVRSLAELHLCITSRWTSAVHLCITSRWTSTDLSVLDK